MAPSGKELDVIAHIREAGEEARNLHRILGKAIKLLDSGDTAKRERALKLSQDTFDPNGKDIDRLLTELKQLLVGEPKLNNDYSDCAARLRNIWDHAYREWIAGDKSVKNFKRIQRDLERFSLETAYIALPPRLNQNLDTLRVGGAMNFAEEFADEVLDSAEAAKVLDWIYRHPHSVGGVTDRSKGVVYKASTNRIVQAISVLSVLVVAGLAIAFPYSRDWLNIKDQVAPKVTSDAALARAVAWGLAGGVLHTLIAVMKDVQRANKEGSDPPTLGNWALWVHVRYISIWFAIIGVVIAVVIAAHVTKGTDLLTMLAVGYSSDSIVDLALPKVASLMGGRTEIVTKALA